MEGNAHMDYRRERAEEDERDLAQAKSWSADLEALADGAMYRHPDSGDGFICYVLDDETMTDFMREAALYGGYPELEGRAFPDLDEEEQGEWMDRAEEMVSNGPMSVLDYFTDRDFDIEYRADAPKIEQDPYSLRSVEIEPAAGVYIDTGDCTVRCHGQWWGISLNAKRVLDDFGWELYFC